MRKPIRQRRRHLIEHLAGDHRRHRLDVDVVFERARHQVGNGLDDLAGQLRRDRLDTDAGL